MKGPLNANKAFVSAMGSVGIDPIELFNALNLSASKLPGRSTVDESEPDSDYEFQSSQLHALLQTAVELSGDPGLAIRLGQNVDIANFGAFGFAIMSSVDMKAATKLHLRYVKIFAPAANKWSSVERDNGLTVRLQQSVGTPAQQQLVTEMAFSNLISNGQFLSGSSTQGIELQLNYPKPVHFSVYQKHIPVPILFDQEYNQCFLPNKWLKLPVRTANPAASAVFIQQCEEMLQGLNRIENTSSVIRRLLIQSAGALLNISQVADHLHVNERTLRRRLNAESTSFRTICDEIRNILAQQYLANTSLNVADIAHLLSYGETVNFRRAFVRWNGLTPSQYRQQGTATKELIQK
jgi:AraC-like DNA-binding protein